MENKKARDFLIRSRRDKSTGRVIQKPLGRRSEQTESLKEKFDKGKVEAKAVKMIIDEALPHFTFTEGELTSLPNRIMVEVLQTLESV